MAKVRVPTTVTVVGKLTTLETRTDYSKYSSTLVLEKVSVVLSVPSEEVHTVDEDGTVVLYPSGVAHLHQVMGNALDDMEEARLRGRAESRRHSR